MIDPEEHQYQEDPSKLHVDARTRLSDVSYFFLGNGLIQAAVQISITGEGTPIALLIMHPEKLGRKKESLTFDSSTGLQGTLLRLRRKNTLETVEPSVMEAHWCHECQCPTVHVQWHTDDLRVTEHFYCSHLNHAVLTREVRIHNVTHQVISLHAETSIPGNTVSVPVNLEPDEEKNFYFRYLLHPETQSVTLDHITPDHFTEDSLHYWKTVASADFHAIIFNHFFNASRYQLPAMISRSGMMDGGIWQYNREWVRDQAMAVIGLVETGHDGLAERMLRRHLKEFVSSDGATVDSSRTRSTEDSELDQNGLLLFACDQYAAWTGNMDFIKEFWPRIKAVAQYPLGKPFRQSSGLLANTREFWERHSLHGLRKGFEAAHHIWMIRGLQAASHMADVMGEKTLKTTWQEESRAFQAALLRSDKFGFIHQGSLIKRLGTDGFTQDTVEPSPDNALPEESPLSQKGTHFLNPDSSVALAVAEELIDPNSALARKTMNSLETLWDQDWYGGGYGRYHVSSEPDSPGAWSFPSLFMARAYLEMKEYKKVHRVLRWLGQIPGGQSGTWFENYGPRRSPPFPQVGITPWTWAEMIRLMVHHILGFRPQTDHLLVRPRLLPDLEHIEALLPLRGHMVSLSIRQSRSAEKTHFETDAQVRETGNDFILVEYPGHDSHIDVMIR